MHRSLTFRLLALLCVLFPASACAGFELTKVVDGRYAIVSTQLTPESPQRCEEEFAQRLDHAGWHDHIYTAIQPDRAYMVFSQRVVTQGVIIGVDITLWKAISAGGKTYTEQWVFKLKPGEVNDFLDSELRTLVVKFKVAPLTHA